MPTEDTEETFSSIIHPPIDPDLAGNRPIPRIVPDIAPGGNVALFTTEHEENGAYDSYAIHTEYRTDHGVRVLPTGGASAVAVRLHTGLTHKIVTWACSRKKAKPKLPHPTTGDPNEVLIDSLIFPSNASQDYFGAMYQCSGRYVYQLLKPKTPGMAGSSYPIGIGAAEAANGKTRYYHYQDFDQNGPVSVQKLLDATRLMQTQNQNNLLLPQSLQASEFNLF